jgi:hypothetical protein
MKDLILKVLREEVSNGKVKCDNCGWSWSLKEGGHDPYICHQCNHNNEPKKLKEDFRLDSGLMDDNLYLTFKRLLKRRGFTHQNVLSIADVLGIRQVSKFVQKYLNEEGIPGIFNKENKIILVCYKCGFSDLKFYFTIVDIDVPSTNFEYNNQIDLYVYVSDRGSGEFEKFDGNTYKGSFYPIVYYETEENLYDDLFSAVNDAITYHLDDELEKYDIKIRIDGLDFTRVKP